MNSKHLRTKLARIRHTLEVTRPVKPEDQRACLCSILPGQLCDLYLDAMKAYVTSHGYSESQVWNGGTGLKFAFADLDLPSGVKAAVALLDAVLDKLPVPIGRQLAAACDEARSRCWRADDGKSPSEHGDAAEAVGWFPGPPLDNELNLPDDVKQQIYSVVEEFPLAKRLNELIESKSQESLAAS